MKGGLYYDATNVNWCEDGNDFRKKGVKEEENQKSFSSDLIDGMQGAGDAAEKHGVSLCKTSCLRSGTPEIVLHLHRHFLAHQRFEEGVEQLRRIINTIHIHSAEVRPGAARATAAQTIAQEFKPCRPKALADRAFIRNAPQSADWRGAGAARGRHAVHHVPARGNDSLEACGMFQCVFSSEPHCSYLMRS